MIVNCDFVTNNRDDFWRDIINVNPIEFSIYMDSLSAAEFTATVLSCDTSFDLEVDELLYFSKCCIYHVHKLCKDFENRNSM